MEQKESQLDQEFNSGDETYSYEDFDITTGEGSNLEFLAESEEELRLLEEKYGLKDDDDFLLKETEEESDGYITLNLQLRNEIDRLTKKIENMKKNEGVLKEKIELLQYKNDEFELSTKMKNSKITRLEGTMDEKNNELSALKAKNQTLRLSLLTIKKKFWDVKHEDAQGVSTRRSGRRNTHVGLFTGEMKSKPQLKKKRSFSAKYSNSFFHQQLDKMSERLSDFKKFNRRLSVGSNHSKKDVKLFNQRVLKEREMLGMSPPSTPNKKFQGSSSGSYQSLLSYKLESPNSPKSPTSGDDEQPFLDQNPPILEVNTAPNSPSKSEVTENEKMKIQQQVIKDLGLHQIYENQVQYSMTKKGYLIVRLNKFLQKWRKLYVVISNNCITFFRSNQMKFLDSCYSIFGAMVEEIVNKTTKERQLNLTIGRISLSFKCTGDKKDKNDDMIVWKKIFEAFVKVAETKRKEKT